MRLRERAFIDLMCCLHYKCVSTRKCFFIDSSPIKVCHNKRINKHRTFKGVAEIEDHSMSWFYEFKIHIIINEKGNIVKFVLTKGNVSDVRELKTAKGLNGLLARDKGYINQCLTKYLKNRGQN